MWFFSVYVSLDIRRCTPLPSLLVPAPCCKARNDQGLNERGSCSIACSKSARLLFWFAAVPFRAIRQVGAESSSQEGANGNSLSGGMHNGRIQDLSRQQTQEE